MRALTTIVVGVWHENEREISHCPSYYAADHETLKTHAGDYPVRVSFQGGYTVPMPYWFLVGLKTTRVSGRLYSGVCGVNYSHTDLKAGEEVDYTLQGYEYSLKDLVASGEVTLHPGFEWLLHKHSWQHPDAPKTWEAVRAIKDSQEATA